MTDHLGLDELADVLAGDAEPAHVVGCPDCSSALAELRAATTRVTADLSGLPPLTLPDDVAATLHERLAPTSSTVTTLPRRTSGSNRRWLPAAAAILVLLAGGGYAVSRLGSNAGGDASTTSTAGGAKAAAPAPEVDVVRNSTGADYTGRASLTAALPGLLGGSPSRDTVAAAPAQPPVAGAQPQGDAGTTMQSRTAVDPLARLRDNAGLADCLVALLPPQDPSVRPLALDYATFKGAPAMVVVLPSSLPDKLDVFVVGPGCSRANDSTLFYTSVAKP